MATCSHADRIIPLLHDNELQNPLRRETVAHMATCVTCARMFSLLEREQELFTQTIDERVEAIDFANFWQAVEMRISQPSSPWSTRLRLWYESWRPAWTFPIPAWAVAVLLLFLIPTHLSLNNDSNDSQTPPHMTENAPSTEPPVTRVETAPLSPQSPSNTAPSQHQFDPQPIQTVGLNDNQAEIESIYTYGPGAVTLRIHHDYESNSTVILYGDGTNEYPQ